MNTKIPREVLWEDKKTMDELLEDPLFKVLHEAFLYFEKEPMLFPMDELAILNEVGYQVTWLCYHSRFGLEPNIENFIREVFVHTGFIDHAMTVVSLVQAVITLVNFPPLNISKRTKRELSKLNKESWCSRYVESFVRRVLRDGYFFDNQFLPNQRDYQISMVAEEPVVLKCAEPSVDEHQDKKCRTFTLDEIIEYAQENLSLDKSLQIQAMLYSLLVVDGTREELKKVASIPSFIVNRDKPVPSQHNEIVLQKHVGTEIQNVEAGGTGVNNEIKKE